MMETYNMTDNKTEITLPNNQPVITDKGLVIVGANGCGKTSIRNNEDYTRLLKKYNRKTIAS